jgi:hypothetical protein
LLEKLSLNVCNYNFRSSTRSLLSTGVHRTNYANNAPFERAIRNFSDKEHCFDFNLTRERYKSMIVSYHGKFLFRKECPYGSKIRGPK